MSSSEEYPAGLAEAMLAGALAEGALLVTARPGHAAAVRASLADEGIPAADVGEVMKGSGRVWIAEADGGSHRRRRRPRG